MATDDQAERQPTDAQTREQLTIEMIGAITSDLEAWVANRPASGGLVAWFSERVDALEARMIAEHGVHGQRAFDASIDALRWFVNHRVRPTR